MIDYNFYVECVDFNKYKKFIKTLPTTRYTHKPTLSNGKWNISLVMEMDEYNKLGLFINSVNEHKQKKDNTLTHIFKKLFKTKVCVFLFLLVSLVSCDPRVVPDYKYSPKIIDEEFSIIVVDSCEYLLQYGDHRTMTHKGNCKFCIERNENQILLIFKNLFL